MKRGIISFLLATLLLVGCGTTATDESKNVGAEESQMENDSDDKEQKTTVIDNRDKEGVQEVSDHDFEKNGYLYENTIGDTLYFYTVKNNSELTVRINGNATAMSSDGSVLGADESELSVLGPEETSVIVFYFDGVTGVDSVETNLTYDTDSYYSPILSKLRMEQTINTENLTLVVTNTGGINAEFVEAYALFMDENNNVLSYDSTYITDGDSEIKPGATLSGQLDAYQKFDHVECFLVGRSTGKSTSPSSEVSDSDFDIKEYCYENSIGDSLYFLVITNNCGKAVGIDINMTAYDASDNVVGADSGEVNIIGAGETSIAYMYFDSVKGIDHVNYVMNYNTSPYYEPVLNDLDVVQNVNSKNVVVTVTNNGTESAEFVEAYALFFDTSGKVVHYDSAYITDGDSEIKPGASLSEQLDSYGTFDTVEVYLTGRK